MTFLPIVERELRVAARRRSTFWLRVVAALVALVIGGGFMILSLIAGVPLASLGKGLFGALTWLSFAAAVLAGLFFTSDCLSEEKREGTLGLLFLTDLRGYDLVLGKLLATSLRGSLALLAVVPVLAIALLMGGVTGPEFWKTILALVNGLFCSLAAGMLVSAVSRDSQKALAATLLLLLLVLGGGPVVDQSLAAASGRAFVPVLSLASPAYVFGLAGARGQGSFWIGLIISQALAWLLLGSACLLLPRTWQQRRKSRFRSTQGWAHRWKYGGAKRRAALRRKLLDLNPVMWLACRERWQSFVIWVIVVPVLGVSVAMLALDPPAGDWAAWSFFGGALTLALYLTAASQACRFFIQARRSGLMELLLAGPLPVKEIVQGQWRALQRMFGLPAALFLCAQVVAGAFSRQMSSSGLAASHGGLALTIAAAVASVVVLAANLITLSWFGMWMGLTSKNANLATLKTLAFVEVIPWFVISFASALILGLVLMPLMMKGTVPSPTLIVNWYPLLSLAVVSVLALGKDIGLSLWARRRIYSSYRERASQTETPARFRVPPVSITQR